MAEDCSTHGNTNEHEHILGPMGEHQDDLGNVLPLTPRAIGPQGPVDPEDSTQPIGVLQTGVNASLPANTVQATTGNIPKNFDFNSLIAMMQEQRAMIERLERNMTALEPKEPVHPRDPHYGITVTDQSGREVINLSESSQGESSEIVKLLESLAKRVESNEKKVEDYRARVDQIPGAPPVIEGPQNKYIVRRPFKPEAAPEPIPKRFKMPKIPLYDGTTDPMEHITAFSCAIAGSDLQAHEVESMMLKKFGETLTKGAMQWYCNLEEHSIGSFELLADAFVEAHAGARKVQAKKAPFLIDQE